MQRLWISQFLCAASIASSLFLTSLFLSAPVSADNRLCDFGQGVSVPCTLVNLGEAKVDDAGLPDIPAETILQDSQYAMEELGEGAGRLHLEVLNRRDWATVDRQVIGNMYKQYIGIKMGELIRYRAAQIETALRKKYGLEGADRAAVLEAAALHYNLPLIDVPGGGDASSLDLTKLLGN